MADESNLPESPDNSETAFPTAPETDAAFQQAFQPEQQAPEVAQPVAPVQPPHIVNMIDPEGQLTGVGSDQLEDAVNSGYTPATEEHVQAYKNQQKYGGAVEQAKTFLEGAGEAATFGLFPAVEQAFGVKPEARIGRREVNPGSHMLGQVVGLTGSAFIPGLGEANVLKAAGEGTAAALGLGLEGAGIVSKIGSGIAKAAVENALFQSGDEVSKMLSKDPKQSVESAMTDIGLSGLLGGATGGVFGAASPLWDAVSGSKLGGALRAITNKAGGIEGIIPEGMQDVIDSAGIEMAPEIKAGLSNDPHIQEMYNTLAQTDSTAAGRELQQSVNSFKKNASDALVSAVGKTPDEVAALENLSEHEVGGKIKDDLANTIKQQYAPIKSAYEEISNKFTQAPLTAEDKGIMAEKIGALASNGSSPESAEGKLIQRVLKEVQGQTNLEQLRKYTGALGRETSGIGKQELWGVARQLRSILGDTEESVLTREVADKSPQLLEKYGATKTAYKDLKNTIGDLNDRLHVGSHAGPDTFVTALRDMDGESVLRRLSPKGRADIISELGTKFPEIAQQVKDFELNKILKTAAYKASGEQIINPKQLFGAIEKMSPEMRQFVLPAGAMEKSKAIQQLLEHFEKMPRNVTNSARVFDSMTKHIPGSAVGMIAMIAGHNPVMGAALGALTRFIGKDAPDAVKLGLLKFLGSGQKVEPGAFKSMVDMIESTIKGNNLVTKGVKNIFKAGQEVLPQSAMPKESDRNKLDKRLKELQVDQKPLTQVGGKVGHYMPDQGQHIGQVAATAVNFLNSIRPGSTQTAPLDTKQPPTSFQKAQYDRALNIAEQPLIVLNHIKAGTLRSSDIVALQNMYPNLYQGLKSKVMDEITTSVQKEKNIPYQTRMSLSLFMGQPLDSTMSPQAIMSAQPQQPGQPQPQSSQPKQSNLHSMKGLAKLPQSYQTPSQAREAKSVQQS